MSETAQKPASKLLVIIAFATVYLVWGSTYFFIQKSIQHVPPLILGVIRFTVAGLLLLLWCAIKGEKLWNWNQIKPAIISGVLLLFIGNGAVIWSEKTLPSSLVAVLVSSSPLWFVLFDKSKWKENFSNKATVAGLITGFAGVILLFGHQVSNAFSSNGSMADVIGISILMIGSISWAVGSLYSKHYSTGSNMVNTAWQMLVGGIAFIPGSLLNKEWATFSWNVPTETWLSVAYLIFFGSLAAYTAYVWLLQVRPATQVSTYAYVNPVVAVLIGVFFGGEKLNTIQVTGLLIILTSVLLINMAKRRNAQKNPNAIKSHYSEKHEHIEKEKIALSE